MRPHQMQQPSLIHMTNSLIILGIKPGLKPLSYFSTLAKVVLMTCLLQSYRFPSKHNRDESREYSLWLMYNRASTIAHGILCPNLSFTQIYHSFIPEHHSSISKTNYSSFHGFICITLIFNKWSTYSLDLSTYLHLSVSLYLVLTHISSHYLRQSLMFTITTHTHTHRCPKRYGQAGEIAFSAAASGQYKLTLTDDLGDLRKVVIFCCTILWSFYWFTAKIP